MEEKKKEEKRCTLKINKKELSKSEICKKWWHVSSDKTKNVLKLKNFRNVKKFFFISLT